MAVSRRIPNTEQLSILIATILLAYAILPYINLPTREIRFPLPGIVFSFQLSASTAIGLIVAGLCGSGTYWILRRHPDAGNQRLYQHLILPGLTALVIGFPLSNVEVSAVWWLIFSLGGVTLLLVIIAEFITVDPNDIRQPAAGGFLTAISYAIFLLLAIDIFASGTRLFILLPVIFCATWLVSLRALHERRVGEWPLPQATVIALMTSQLAAAYHYLPLSPIAAGLLCGGPAYALTQFFGNINQGQGIPQAVIEPIVSLVIIIGIAVWIQ
jgi:Protein of unknown function (DUF5656)